MSSYVFKYTHNQHLLETVKVKTKILKISDLLIFRL